MGNICNKKRKDSNKGLNNKCYFLELGKSKKIQECLDDMPWLFR